MPEKEKQASKMSSWLPLLASCLVHLGLFLAFVGFVEIQTKKIIPGEKGPEHISLYVVSSPGEGDGPKGNPEGQSQPENIDAPDKMERADKDNQPVQTVQPVQPVQPVQTVQPEEPVKTSTANIEKQQVRTEAKPSPKEPAKESVSSPAKNKRDNSPKPEQQNNPVNTNEGNNSAIEQNSSPHSGAGSGQSSAAGTDENSGQKANPREDATEKQRLAATLQAALEKNKYYPKAAQRAQREGDVQVLLIIDSSGSIEGASLVGTPNKLLGEGALTTVENVKKNWKYTGWKQGKIELVLTIQYRLE